MYTVEEIAQQIEALKPDFKEFIELLKNNDSSLLSHVANTKNIYEKLFKAQLVLITNKTHAQRWSWGDTERILFELVYNHVSNALVSIGSTYNGKINYNGQKYYINDQFHSNHIAAHIKDVKPYLTPYLWNRVRIKADLNVDIKELKPDKFTLQIFSNYLAGLKKPLPSTRLKEYINQIKGFEDNIKQEYLDVILNHPKNPSLNLQKSLEYITPNQNTTKVQKFMWLTKYSVGSLAESLQIPVPPSVLDDRCSDYKPFITNIKRVPTTELNQLSYLVGAANVFKVASKLDPNPVYDYFAEQIIEHLKHEDYKEPLKDYLKTFSTFNEVSKEFSDGFI